MTNKNIVDIVKFTENLTNGGSFTESKVKQLLNVSHKCDRNLGIYEGILIIYNFYKFGKIPQKEFKKISTDERFIKCVHLLNKGFLSPCEIGDLFFNIINIPDNEGDYRDILLGCFFGSLWSLMNNDDNFELVVNYGVEIVKSAFSLDKFNFLKKVKIKGKNIKVINLAGSGKKEIKLLNISSLVSIITAAVGKKIGESIIVEKTISRATSSVTGSSDIFESIGVNLDMSIDKMAEISLKTGLGVFDINKIVPRLNHVYDGRLHNVQVFAGLVGGAAIVNPIDVNLINYGLTRGSSKLSLTVLNKLYPDKNIIVLQGKNSKGQSVIDQMSVIADTDIAQIIKEKESLYSVTPKDFGFNFKPFRYIETTNNQKNNINKFVKLLSGEGNDDFKQIIAMEVALNLFGLGIMEDFKESAALALEIIDSGAGISIVEDLICSSNGNLDKFKKLLKNN